MEFTQPIGWILPMLVMVTAAKGQTCHSGEQKGRYLIPDPSNCARYFHCSAGVSTPQLMTCGQGTLFDVTTHRCQHAQTVDCGTRARPLRTRQPSLRSDFPPPTTAPPLTVYELSMAGGLTISTTNVTSCTILLGNLNASLERLCLALNVRCSTPQITCRLSPTSSTGSTPPTPVLRSFWNYQ